MEKGIQEHYQAAMKFAGEAHAFQEVPGTKDANYLLHVSNVAMEVLVAHAAEPTFDLALAVQMAALHDTVEDTKTTIEDISKTFGPHVAEGVAALTKNKSESSNENVLADSLTRIKNTSGPEAAIVKLADRITNLQEPPKDEKWDYAKTKKYQEQARVIAGELGYAHAYLKRRIEAKIEEYTQYVLALKAQQEN